MSVVARVSNCQRSDVGCADEEESSTRNQHHEEVEGSVSVERCWLSPSFMPFCKWLLNDSELEGSIHTTRITV